MSRVALAALALVLLSACQVGLTVDIDSQADGTGRARAVVNLDEDAVRRAPDLADQLRADDLRAAGWQVTGPRPSPDGGVTVEAAKRFRSPGEAAQVAEELGGADGPFRGVRLHRSRSFVRTRTSLEGAVDLSAGLGAFADEKLRALGFEPAEVERQLGAPAADVLHMRVVARLPGRRASWRARLGERVALATTAEQWNVRNLAAAAIALVTGVAAVALALRRARHPR